MVPPSDPLKGFREAMAAGSFDPLKGYREAMAAPTGLVSQAGRVAAHEVQGDAAELLSEFADLLAEDTASRPLLDWVTSLPAIDARRIFLLALAALWALTGLGYGVADIDAPAHVDKMIQAFLALAVFLSEWIEYRSTSEGDHPR